jgi:hypothetical protein
VPDELTEKAKTAPLAAIAALAPTGIGIFLVGVLTAL